MAAIQQAQVDQIVHAVRGGGSRIETLESNRSEDWMNWRSNFELSVQISGWNDSRGADGGSPGHEREGQKRD